MHSTHVDIMAARGLCQGTPDIPVETSLVYHPGIYAGAHGDCTTEGVHRHTHRGRRDFDEVVAGATIVVTVRHPDYENEHYTFGNPITGIDIDLGGSFDVTKLGCGDWDQVLDWAVSLYDEADRLPRSTAGLEAAAFIRQTAEETLAQCLPYDSDGCSVAHHIHRRRAQRV